MENGDWFSLDDITKKKKKNDKYQGARPKDGLRGSRQEVSSRVSASQTMSSNLTDYSISSAEFTQNDYREFDVRFAGIIPGISVDVDVTNRTEVLRIIDSGKKQGKIPLYTKYEKEVILSVSKSNIKVLRRVGEEVILRIPIHEIAAICYIKDDRVHILSIKHGNQENCDLAVMYCDNQSQAQDICALVEKCFQMVYIEYTIQLLERAIDDKSVASSDSTITTPSHLPSFMSGSHDPIYPPHPRDVKDMWPKPKPRTVSDSGKSDNNSTISSRAKLVKEYLEELPNQFNLDELTEFAKLLKTLNDSSSQISFQEFCVRIHKLYGPQRKNLLGGLCPFIPEADYRYFADFLKKHDVKEPADGTLSSRNSFPGLFRRSVSDISANGSDFDDIMDKISTQFQQIDASVGSVSNSYLP